MANRNGILIKTFRIHKGMSQSELCEKANISQSTLSDYEKGVREMRFDVFRALLKHIGAETRVYLSIGVDELHVEIDISKSV